ncbi:2-phosphosulfolactate phosphatase family protein, partial [Acaryochloris marina NIES-2412]|uniref:2-phosphosulfolactate phosphatase family protein n=1 Tax=Acaryochloris marina TaxID=155978 RepID=UPI0040597D52
MKLFVYHTPEEIPNNRLPGCAVVIDVLRASSTIAAAINAGAEAVRVFSEIEPLLEASEAVEEDKRIRAGERGGRKVKSCEFGNSPLAFTPENTAGRRLFLSTTNGTRCSESVRNASKVIMASLTNRQAVVNYLATKNPGTVWLVASGWEGSYSLEDTVCAGAIIDGILASGKTPLSKLAGNDEAIAAVSLFQQWKDQLPELLANASHGQRLLKMRGKADVAYCSQLDVLDTLPIQKGLGTFVQRKPGVIEKTCE